MSMPFYASAEQIMRDRSEYARKNVSRGRGVVVLKYPDGILLVAENTVRTRCTRSARSTTGSPSPASGSTTSTRTCAWRASGSPTCAGTPTTAAT